jgi:hypothetical protein
LRVKKPSRTTMIKVTVAVLVIAVGLILWSRNTVPAMVFPPDEPLRGEQTGSWLDSVREVARTGDWLVLRGYHQTDHLVASATNQPFSHVAVLDMERDEVVEAVGAGIRTMDLRERLHESHHVMVMRPRWWRAERAAQAIADARARVGGSYDFLGTVGVGTSGRFYCSELAVHIYRQYFAGDEGFTGVLEPGHMYLWGAILYDSRTRD